MNALTNHYTAVRHTTTNGQERTDY